MKYIITESQYKKFVKSSQSFEKAIRKYLDDYISQGKRKIGKKSRNYGNLREDWCVNGVESINVVYYYEDDKFQGANLFVSKSIIDDIKSIFKVRESFVIHVFEEWYDETMVPKFESIVGETGFFIDEIYKMERDHNCIPEPTKPEDITDEEMINFIVNNTAYSRDNVIYLINNGKRDLEDFYLDIVDTVNRKEQLGL